MHPPTFTSARFRGEKTYANDLTTHPHSKNYEHILIAELPRMPSTKNQAKPTAALRNTSELMRVGNRFHISFPIVVVGHA
jgi:hypothetical protein